VWDYDGVFCTAKSRALEVNRWRYILRGDQNVSDLAESCNDALPSALGRAGRMYQLRYLCMLKLIPRWSWMDAYMSAVVMFWIWARMLERSQSFWTMCMKHKSVDFWNKLKTVIRINSWCSVELWHFSRTIQKVNDAIDNGLVVRGEGVTTEIGVVLNGHGVTRWNPCTNRYHNLDVRSDYGVIPRGRWSPVGLFNGWKNPDLTINVSMKTRG